MLGMTAICCSVALVSCGKTAKSKDKEASDAAAAQARVQAERLEKQRLTDEETLKASLEAANRRQQQQGGNPQQLREQQKANQAPGTTPVNTPSPGPSQVPPVDPKKNGTVTGAPASPPASTVGPEGPRGPEGPPGPPGPSTSGGGAGEGGGTITSQSLTPLVPVVPTGAAARPVSNSVIGGGGGGNVGRETGALSGKQALEDLADRLTQSGGTWEGANITAETSNSAPEAQQCIFERFTVDKNLKVTRLRQLRRGDCVSNLGNLEPYVDGTIIEATRKSASGDVYTFQVDIRPAYVAPAQGNGTAATTPAVTPVIHDLIEIHTPQFLYFAKEGPLGQPAPVGGEVPKGVDERTKLKPVSR